MRCSSAVVEEAGGLCIVSVGLPPARCGFPGITLNHVLCAHAHMHTYVDTLSCNVIQIHTHHIHTDIHHIHIYTDTHHIHIRTHRYTPHTHHTHIHTHTHRTHIHTDEHTCTYVCIYTDSHTQIRTYHAHIHTTHTQTHR